MDKYAETFATWNNIAALYEGKFMDMDLYNETYDYLCQSISKKGAKLLEIACGPGNITKYLLAHRPDFDILGIDIAPNMIALAQKNNPSASFAVMDCRDMGSLNTIYDGIVMGFCLPYLSTIECKDLLIQSSALLHEEGIIYLSFVAGDPALSDFKTGSGGRVYFQYHDIKELSLQLSAAGFVERKTFTLNFKTAESSFDKHTVVVAQKKVRLA